MNTKRNFGTFLSLLGMALVIFTAILLYNTDITNVDLKKFAISGIIGLLFFYSGIGIVSTTKDEA